MSGFVGTVLQTAIFHDKNSKQGGKIRLLFYLQSYLSPRNEMIA